MIERVEKFNHTFVVRTGDDAAEMWGRECDSPAPPQVITFATTDGQDGLMWPDWETFWVEYGLHPMELNAKRLLKTLLDHVLNNPSFLKDTPE
jgi:hypothetical protein